MVPFVPNRPQADYLTNRTKRNIILKPRQIGFTTLLLAKNLLTTIRRPYTHYALLAQDDDQVMKLRERLKMFLHQLEQHGACPTVGIDNEEQMTFPVINSRISYYSGQSDRVGRGDTIDILHITELAFMDKGGKHVGTLLPAVPDNGTIDIESTPNGMGGVFYNLFREAMDPSSGSIWRPFFYPWWWSDEYHVEDSGLKRSQLDEEEMELYQRFERDGLTLDKIAWRRRKKAEYVGTDRSFEEEYPEDPVTCFMAGALSPFKPAEIHRLMARCRPPLAVETVLPRGQLRIWEYPDPTAHYVIGGDPAEGIEEGDYSALSVIKVGVRPVHVAGYKGKIRPGEFAKVACDLAYRYNTALLALERNGVGLTAVEKAVYDLNYPNFYYDIDPFSSSNRGDIKPGWSTNHVTRPRMIEEFVQALAGGLLVTEDEDLVREASTLSYVESESGARAQRFRRIEAARGEYDDYAFATMIAIQALKQAGTTGRRARPVRK